MIAIASSEFLKKRGLRAPTHCGRCGEPLAVDATTPFVVWVFVGPKVMENGGPVALPKNEEEMAVQDQLAEQVGAGTAFAGATVIGLHPTCAKHVGRGLIEDGVIARVAHGNPFDPAVAQFGGYLAALAALGKPEETPVEVTPDPEEQATDA